MSTVAPKTILYIEDNPVNVYLVQSVLEARPEFELLIAAAGAEGLDLARQRRPALVLLDMNLPDMHGSEFLRRLRDSEASESRATIIVVSADTVAEQRELFAGLDVAEFIAKPFDLDAFEQTVCRWANS